MPKLKLTLLSLTSSLLIACATTSDTQASTASDLETETAQPKSSITFVNNTVSPTTNANGEALICKDFKKTGTRLKTVRQCNTQAEWDRIKKQTQDNIKNMYLKYGSDHG